MATSEQSTGSPASGPETALLTDLAAALRRVCEGDLRVRLPRATGVAGEVVDAFNDLVALQQRQHRDLRRISRLAGRDGRVTERIDEEGYEGAWVEGIQAINLLIDYLALPATEAARVIEAVAEGDLTQHMPTDIDGRPLKGEY